MDMDFKECRRLKRSDFGVSAQSNAERSRRSPLTRFPLWSKDTEFPATEVI